MIVAVICDVLGEENNGTTIAAMNLIRTLRAKGHQVRVVSPDANRVGEPGHYVVPTRNLGIFNNYVAKNGVSLAKPVRSILEAALDGVCSCTHFPRKGHSTDCRLPLPGREF